MTDSHPAPGPEALNERGMRLTDAERYDDAIAAFDAALQFDPGNSGIRYNRGEALRRAGRFAQARAELVAVLEAEGEAPDLLLALGLVAYESDDYPAAISHYERAIAIRPDYPEAWNDLGVVRFRSEDYPKARQCFEKAVALRPDYAEAWFNLADTYEELGLAADERHARACLREIAARGLASPEDEGEED